jgi:hypothetical protein
MSDRALYWTIGVVVGGVMVLTFCVMLLARHELHRCWDNGGHFENRNCHIVHDMDCITTDWGDGMLITNCMPRDSTSCDSVCIGARAEAQ